MPHLSATVAICTRNRGAMVAECVRSVLALDPPDFKVLIVDQSDDEKTSLAAAEAAGGDRRLEIIRTRTVGLSVARNLAAGHATSDVIAYTDDDCAVDRGWLEAILSEFEVDRVDAVFGRVVPPGFTSRRGVEVAFKASTDRAIYQRPTPPWHVGHGASMAVRRASLLKIGGFDNSLGAGTSFPAADDLDVAYRLAAAGGWLAYTGAAVAYHKDWRDWRSRRRVERGYGVGAGATFMKYLRCGDLYGAKLFLRWTWELGVRRVGAGLLKWRSTRPMYLGYCQLVYPWIGMARSLRRKIDPRTITYYDLQFDRAGRTSVPQPARRPE